MKVVYNKKLSNYTTIHLGGVAKKICFPSNVDELKSLLICHKKDNLIVIGNGSNIAFRDGGYNGVVVSLNKFNKDLLTIKENKLIVGAGVSCAKFAKFAHKNKIPGYEFLHGIPGSMGGAMAMNAGAFNISIWDKIFRYKVIGNDGDIESFGRNQMSTFYRKVQINRKLYFIEAEFLIDTKVKFNQNLILRYAMKRRSTQPVNQWSSGCIFKNPTSKCPASYLIEKSDLKSKKVGGIYVSQKHSNYFINDGNGTCNDLEKLISFVKNRVKKEHNVNLDCEIHIFGTKL